MRDDLTRGAMIFGNAVWTAVSAFMLFVVVFLNTRVPDGGGIGFWTWVGLVVWAGIFAYYLRRLVVGIIDRRAPVDKPDDAA